MKDVERQIQRAGSNRGVITVVQALSEYMVVIGQHVGEVYKEVCIQAGLDTAKENTCEKPEKKSGLETALLTVMAGIGPTLYLLGASGMIKGILAVCVMLGLSADTTVYTVMYALGDGLLYFLPLVLGIIWQNIVKSNLLLVCGWQRPCVIPKYRDLRSVYWE